ncbi:MAG: hypothetical protein JWN24_737 [Phycisphaerales bacterium]|nr:hypothetical protein [Phycisphaerales bacterium]
MSYGVVMSTKASEDLARLPYALAEFVIQQIMHLSDDPVNRSRRATFPLPRGQICTCTREFKDVEYHFTIRFDYGLDEKHIRIASILADPPFDPGW